MLLWLAVLAVVAAALFAVTRRARLNAAHSFRSLSGAFATHPAPMFPSKAHRLPSGLSPVTKRTTHALCLPSCSGCLIPPLITPTTS